MARSAVFGRGARWMVLLTAGASLAACATMEPRYSSQATGPSSDPAVGVRKVGKPYQVAGVWYVPREQPDYDERGVASWYGDQFHLKATANGETFDMNAVSAAHTTLPLPSMVEVTNLDNGRKLIVRVNDRGPFADNRIIDLSREAATQLGFQRAGLANVRVRYVGPAPLLGPADGLRSASAKPLPTRPPPAAAPPAIAPTATVASVLDPLPTAPAATAPVGATITAQALPPLSGRAIASTPVAPPATAAAPASPLRIQAGAFSSEANAQRAVARLSSAGPASIELLQRDGLTLYRVVLPAPEDEAAAYALRDRVAEIGFTEARVVRTF